jgi:hypothetical protein
VNSITGSVIVNYDEDRQNPWEILSVLRDHHFIEEVTASSLARPRKKTSSDMGTAIGKALFGWAVGKAFEGSSLSFLAAFI